MKKLLLLSILINGICFGQETIKTSNNKYVKLNSDKTWEYVDNPNSISKNDFKPEDDGYRLEKKFIINSGKNIEVSTPISIKINKKYFDDINFELFPIMIEKTANEAKKTLKNQSTFFPIKLMAGYVDEDGLLFILDFTGQNDYGADKDSSTIVYFDKLGNIIKK